MFDSRPTHSFSLQNLTKFIIFAKFGTFCKCIADVYLLYLVQRFKKAYVGSDCSFVKGLFMNRVLFKSKN